MSESMKIPYNTWGGVPQSKTSQASRSLTISAGEVPYNYTPLTSNLYISSDLTDVEPLPLIMNMANYARLNIPNYNTITSIPEEHLPNSINTSLAQNWSYAFNNCRRLTNLPDPFYNTSNATNLYGMFGTCNSYLTTIPNFDTSNVTDMSRMFYYCYRLSNIPNFNTNNVINMQRMFERCYDITIAPNFNTSKVIDMGAMFKQCIKLTSIPNFDTSNVINMSQMLDGCEKLTTIPNFDTNNVTNMYNMFSDCRIITTIPNNFNTNNVTNMTGIFRNCFNLIDIPNINTDKIIDMSYMFDDCHSLVTLPNFDTSNAVNMSSMFASCNKLTTVPNFNTSNVTDMDSMFWCCYNIITSPNFDTSNVTNMSEMFKYCSNLVSIPIFNINSVSNISSMYANCGNIQGNLYISSNNVTNAKNLFTNAPNYTKNIYCHVNTNTYNTIYSAMGNNTYYSSWNTYLKTFENDPITKIQLLSNFSYSDETALQNQVSTTTFRSPVNRVYIRGYQNQSTNIVFLGGPYLKIDPYTDYNLTTIFTHSQNESSSSGLEIPIAFWVEYYISNNTTNTQIYNSANIGTTFLPGEKTMYFYLEGYYLAEGAEDPETPIDISNIK